MAVISFKKAVSGASGLSRFSEGVADDELVASGLAGSGAGGASTAGVDAGGATTVAAGFSGESVGAVSVAFSTAVGSLEELSASVPHRST